MSEKTAEEKLRQELEGSLTEHTDSNAKRNPKPLRPRQKLIPRRNPDNIRDKTDTFMDDLERRIEQSLNTVVNTTSDHQEKPRPPKKSTAVKHKSPDTIKHETSALITEAVPVTRTVKPEPHRKVQAIREEPSVVPENQLDTQPIALEAEPLPDDSPVIQETDLPEVHPVKAEHELPEIPILEADLNQDINTFTGALPEIPVILPDENDDDDNTQNFTDDFPDFTEPQQEQQQETYELPQPDTDVNVDDVDEHDEDSPSENHQQEFQEAELIEAPDIEDEFADVTDTEDDTVSDDTENEQPTQSDIESDTDSEQEAEYEANSDFDSETFEPHPQNDDFTPSADIVVNVDDDLPQISRVEEPQPDPEAESVPVTVTMPESTKTAEDKLMADIAEAMTGSPLSLDSHDPQEIYTLPENFFTDENSGESKSAEDKLKANIAQALSESPIATAQSKANQNLEQDLNPFDDVSIPDSFYQTQTQTRNELNETQSEVPETDINIETETETESPDDEHHDEFLPDFNSTSTFNPNESEQESETSPFDDSYENDETVNNESLNSVSDIAPDDEIDEAVETDTPSPFDETQNDGLTVPDNQTEYEPDDPFPIPESEEAEQSAQELQEEFEAVPFTAESPEPEPDNENNNENETHDDDSTPEGLEEFGDLPFTLGDDDENDNDNNNAETHEIKPVNAAETELDSLTREVAAAKQANQFIHEEAQPDNNMPEESLLDLNEKEHYEEDPNDWDVSSLGELSEAATIPEHDNEEFHSVPETVTEVITPPHSGTVSNPEDEHKEKTMSIREKLASRKNSSPGETSSPKTKSSSSGGSGLIMPVLMTLLLIVGGLIFWQLMQLSDKLTSLSMNSPAFESIPVVESKPSYDYAIDFILDPNLTERMAQRGRDGWQVVGSRRTQDSTTGQYGYEFIFMRRTQGR